jgi:hypothetical protein
MPSDGEASSELKHKGRETMTQSVEEIAAGLSADAEYEAREAYYAAKMRADMDSYPVWKVILELVVVLGVLGLVAWGAISLLFGLLGMLAHG